MKYTAVGAVGATLPALATEVEAWRRLWPQTDPSTREQEPTRHDGLRYRRDHYHRPKPEPEAPLSETEPSVERAKKAGDIILSPERLRLLKSATERLKRAQSVVGYGNFNLLSYDDYLRCANRYVNVGAVPTAEIEFLEELYDRNAADYGFLGEKVLTRISETIDIRDVVKIPGSGHYLLKGRSLMSFERIRRDVGESMVLTSGVRGMAKQFYLFMSKATKTGGNLSEASHSLAPPGYSYHGAGDFDVGKSGYGLKNFTPAFAMTEVYERMIGLGYVKERYDPANPFGVRHEPWHIKIV